MAAGYATGVSIEAKDVKAANRSRKIKFFLDKMKEQEKSDGQCCKTGKRSDCKKGSSLDKGGSSDYRTCTFSVGSFSGNRCSSGYCCDSDSL